MPFARLRVALAATLVFALCVSLAEAAGFGVTVHQVDSSQFPKMRAIVSVTGDQGVRVADLEADPQAFEVVEDDKPVTGLKVEPILDTEEPIAVAIVMDVSGSMVDEGKMDAAKQAATAFVDTLGSKDAAAIISFSTEVRIVQGYTADKGALKNAIIGLAAKGDTDLYGAVTQSAQLIGALPQAQRAILLISDGEDTIGKGSLNGSIQAAKTAKTAIYAIGLGKEASAGVLKDVLVKLGSGTGGQAVFVANPAELKNAFVKQGEQFRRRYLLTYTSKLPGDDKAHTLMIRAKKGEQSGEGKGQFTAKRIPLDFDVVGLADATKVSGLIRVQVAVKNGVAQGVELLVDEKARGSAGAPFALQWDTSAESPGMHKVIVRVKDSTGTATDRSFVVNVEAPATAIPTATVAPPTATPAPTVVPTPAPAATDNTLLYAIAGLVGVGLIGGGAFVFLRRQTPTPVAPPLAAPEPPKPMDRTEVVLPPEPEPAPAPPVEATIVAAPPPPPQPRARLQITHHGAETEFLAAKPEIVMGRGSTNDIVIIDPLASRRHARVVAESGEFWLEDLKSMNGTRVNGEVVARHKLASGDQVRIGDAVIVFTPLPHEAS